MTTVAQYANLESASGRWLRLSQIGAFLAIGLGAAALFIAVSSFAVSRLDILPQWLVSTLCYGAFIYPVYLLHRRFSFRSDARHRVALPRYVAVQVSGLALASLFSFIAYGVMGLPAILASTLVIGLTSGVNFAVLRLWAFSDRA